MTRDSFEALTFEEFKTAIEDAPSGVSTSVNIGGTLDFTDTITVPPGANITIRAGMTDTAIIRKFNGPMFEIHQSGTPKTQVFIGMVIVDGNGENYHGKMFDLEGNVSLRLGDPGSVYTGRFVFQHFAVGSTDDALFALRGGAELRMFARTLIERGVFHCDSQGQSCLIRVHDDSHFYMFENSALSFIDAVESNGAKSLAFEVLNNSSFETSEKAYINVFSAGTIWHIDDSLLRMVTGYDFAANITNFYVKDHFITTTASYDRIVIHTDCIIFANMINLHGGSSDIVLGEHCGMYALSTQMFGGYAPEGHAGIYVTANAWKVDLIGGVTNALNNGFTSIATFLSNHSGGFLYSESPTALITIDGGDIQDCKSLSGYGGAIYVPDYSLLHIGADLFMHDNVSPFQVTLNDPSDIQYGNIPGTLANEPDQCTSPFATALNNADINVDPALDVKWYYAVFHIPGVTDLYLPPPVLFEPGETDTHVPEPYPPSREGYEFKGWYLSPTGGEKWDFNTQVKDFVEDEATRGVTSHGVDLYALMTKLGGGGGGGVNPNRRRRCRELWYQRRRLAAEACAQRRLANPCVKSRPINQHAKARFYDHYALDARARKRTRRSFTPLRDK